MSGLMTRTRARNIPEWIIDHTITTNDQILDLTTYNQGQLANSRTAPTVDNSILFFKEPRGITPETNILLNTPINTPRTALERARQEQAQLAAVIRPGNSNKLINNLTNKNINRRGATVNFKEARGIQDSERALYDNMRGQQLREGNFTAFIREVKDQEKVIAVKSLMYGPPMAAPQMAEETALNGRFSKDSTRGI